MSLVHPNAVVSGRNIGKGAFISANAVLGAGGSCKRG